MPKRRASKPLADPRAERLAGYRAKRDFGRTPEPAPAQAAHRGPQRFVIHEHSARRLHWDLRLERDGALASWAVPKGLPEAPKENRFAAATEDHPLEYLDFEGEIPKGQYGAGTIKIWDSGTYDCLKWEPRKIEVALHGRRLDARYALFPIDSAPEPKDWMIHRMDPPADPGREPMPSRVMPMLARAGELPADDDQRWAYEIKWDGIRAIAYSSPGELRLESRNLIAITERYPELSRLKRALGSHSAVLDGEIVALDSEGRPSFSALQQRMQVRSPAQAKRQATHTPVTYVVFDLLWLDGHSLMSLSYRDRRARLAELKLDGESWRVPDHILGHASALLQASAEQGLEGVLAKRLDSPYEPGVRSRAWLKVKSSGRQEFVIGGWMPGKGKREERIGSLLLGVYEPDGSLRHVGRVGTGLSEREIDRLQGLLAPLKRTSTPFASGSKPPRGAMFAEPELVAEVRFSEWTSAGNLRHPSYVGLREDKPAAQVTGEVPAGAEQAGAPAARAPGAPGGALQIVEKAGKTAYATVAQRELKLSNLDKVLYPQSGFTKRELIDYYARVAPAMLPHLEGRALTVTRWPDGVEGKSFYQKQAPAHRPEWVRTVTLHSERKPIDYTLADDLATLVWLANLAAIELHTPLARAEAIERPSSVVFDLDPGAPASVIECAQVAVKLRGMFANLGLESFVKSSGSKGLQVYVPLNDPDVRFEHSKAFAKAVAEVLQQSEPELVVAQMSRARRAGKVLIDWSQNDRNKTTVCVYSLRASARPTVSTPLEWAQVSAALQANDPAKLTFEAHEVLARVGEHGDLFAPVLSLVQRLPAF